MKCPYCSKNLAPGARSCGKCGNYLGESFGGESFGDGSAPAKSHSKKPIPVSATTLLVLILGIAALCTAIVIWYLGYWG